MLFRSTYPRVAGSGTHSQNTGSRPDVQADGHLDRGFLSAGEPIPFEVWRRERLVLRERPRAAVVRRFDDVLRTAI